MKLIVKKKYDFTNLDIVAIFLTEEYNKEIDTQIPQELSFIKDRIDLSFFKGKSSEVLFLPFNDLPNIIITGIGKKDEINKESLRNCSNSIVAICRKRDMKTINVVLPILGKLDELEILTSLAEGIYLSNYDFNRYKSEDDDTQTSIERAVFYSDRGKEAGKILGEIEIISKNTHLCRDLVNETSEKSNPLSIANEAKSLSSNSRIKCRIYGRKELEKMKMGLFLAVSRGSKIDPQLVVLQYRGNTQNKKSIVVVGKGITFDSGGINLKPSGHIEGMRQIPQSRY